MAWSVPQPWSGIRRPGSWPLIGSSLGILAGYAGRRTDLCLMFCMDILLAFPATLLAIAIVAMIGPGRGTR